MRRAPFTIREIKLLWKLHYKAGISTTELAEQLYEKKGYKNSDSCRRYLTDAFKQYMDGIVKRCKCGALMSQRTVGCSNCTARHYYRKSKGTGLKVVPAPKRRLKTKKHTACGRCKGPIDELNPSCVTCRNRISSRKKRGYYERFPQVKLRVRKAPKGYGVQAA